ncbi:MAG TPA: cysteine dioxygenase family protein [Pyrinomonadaceae bacterium]|nr:cysteine dioxygenase family protein [Pyrinomonadaceae bacterium]
MTRLSIDELVNGLREIPDDRFVCEPIYDYLNEHPVDVGSIQKFLFWSSNCYTRNLIYKDERFEMMAICWERGQVSRVHNHSEQRCWMTVPIGRLKGQNFAVEEIDESIGYCKLKETDSFELAECLAAKVELEEPIHQILNLPEYNDRAVSIHLYSKPYDHCISYCRDTDTYKDVKLFYTSVDGQLCDGVRL